MKDNVKVRLYDEGEINAYQHFCVCVNITTKNYY